MGGVKKHTATIAGATWQLNNLPADRGLEGIRLLAVILGEPAAAAGGMIAAAIKNAPKSEEAEATEDGESSLGDFEIGDGTFGQILGAICGGLSKPEVKKLIELVLDGLVKDGKFVDFNMEFASNYLALAQVVGWALKINFADFFAAAPALTGGLLKKVSTSTPQTSTGD